MNPGLKILRRVEGLWPDVERNIDEAGDLIAFDDGTKWVDNDHPWDAVTGHQIVTHTVEFIVTDGQYGKLAGPYRDLKKAEQVRASAKVEFVTEIAGIEDEEFVPEPMPEIPAPVPTSA